MDIVDAATRSRMMSGIRGKDTRPEILVRRFLHAAGFRFRLHCRDLPGSPDIVLPGRSVAIQVHGCFWHAHEGCRYATSPRSRKAFWQVKLGQNRARDEAAVARLIEQGWRVLVIWECALRTQADLGRLSRRVERWILGRRKFSVFSGRPN